MGHVHMECGTGEHAENDLQFGDWMIAEEETWRPGTPRVRSAPGGDQERHKEDRGDRLVGRGRGTGRAGRGPYTREGVWMEKKKTADSTSSKKRASKEAGLDGDKEDELKDTASSPVKRMGEDSSNAGEQISKKQLCMDVVPSGSLDLAPPPPQYVSRRERKKQKRTGGSEKEGSSSMAWTGSSEERRREQ